MCTGSLLRIHFQCKIQEISKHRGQVALVLDLRRTVGSNQPQRAEGRLGQVRRLALNHLNGHDAQRPNVDFAAVLLSRDDFGGHPVRRANHSGTLVLGLVDGRTETEIGWRNKHG